MIKVVISYAAKRAYFNALEGVALKEISEECPQTTCFLTISTLIQPTFHTTFTEISWLASTAGCPPLQN